MPKTHHFRNPKARLSAALDTLENFTQSKASKSIPHIFHPLKDENGLKKIVRIARCFVAATISEKVRKDNEEVRDKIEDDILNAIDDLKRFHPLMSQKETSETKILRERALQAIQQYNQVIENAQKDKRSWLTRLLHFLFKGSCISLKKNHKVELPSTQNRKNQSQQKVERFVEKLSKSMTERETDAFRMKAISLIKNHGRLFSSMKEAICSIREFPIYSTVSSKGMIQLEQVLTPFPGEKIILKGAFQRDPNAFSPSTPIPGSFSIRSESSHTGFPHPLQYTGWTLADTLIPSQIHRQEDLQYLPGILEKKKQVTKVFMEKGVLFDKAKQLLNIKRVAIEENREEFLELHKTLCLAINPDLKGEVDRYFCWLQAQESPWIQLAHLYNQINEEFITKPFNALQRAWIEQNDTDLLSHHPEIISVAALRILCQELENVGEESMRDFVASFGLSIGHAAKNIILQYFSETIQCAPPQLSLFEKKIQSMVFKQIQVFSDELFSDLPSKPFDQLRKCMTSDIEHFQSQEVKDPVVTELKRYYASRF